jgi:hypothetical protein
MIMERAARAMRQWLGKIHAIFAVAGISHLNFDKPTNPWALTLSTSTNIWLAD